MGTIEYPRRRRWGSRVSAVLVTGLAIGLLGISCSDSKPAVDARDDEGLEMCCTLGAVCHVADLDGNGEGGAGGADSSDAPKSAQECHWLGHDSDPDRCREFYDHCLELCEIDEEQEKEVTEHACR